MPTGQGRTKSKTEIRTTYGCILKFKNNLPAGTKIWIYYNDNMDVVKIEKRTDEYAPEYNPPIRYNGDVGDGE